MATDMNKCVLYEQQSFVKSSFMRELHTAPDGEALDIPIMSEVYRVPWISYQTALVAQTAQTDKTDGQDQVVFNPSHMMDYLFYSYLGTQSPRVSVKQNFRGRVRISWPRNLFHHLIISAQVRFGTSNGPSLPNGWLDHQCAWFMKPGQGQEATYNRSIGNLYSLTDWASFLPSRPLTCPQPWWFSESMNNAVPLFLCDKTPMSLRYSFNLQILRLLKMQIKTDSGWVDVTSLEKKAGFLDDIDMGSKFPIPHMTGRYGKMDKGEREYKLEHPQSVLATSIIKKVTSNPVGAGKSASIELDTSTPIYSIYFSARHVKAQELGNLSNYTTNPHDKYRGWDPIRTVTHFYSGSSSRVQDQSDFGNMQPWYHATSSPREAGYGMFAKSRHPSRVIPDVGLVYDKELAGSIEFQMDDVNITDSVDPIGGDDMEEFFKRTADSCVKDERKAPIDSYHISVFLLTRYIISYRAGYPVLIDDGTRPIDNYGASSSS